MNSEQIWYVYQQNTQLGPFTKDQISQLLDTKMIAQDAYIFKIGWKDWSPIEQALAELQGQSGDIHRPQPPVGAGIPKRCPRASIQGRVIVHNNGQLVIGSGVNISSTGIFVETKDRLFTIGEHIKLTVKAEGVLKPFNAVAEVVRFNDDPSLPIGYGLRFNNLDPQIEQDINQLIHTQQQGQDPVMTQQAR